MFKLIKWLIILSVIIAFVYGVNFFRSLDEVSRQEVKNDAKEAIDRGDPKVLVEPLSRKVREDVEKKKENAFVGVKEKLKKALNRLLGE